MRIGLLNNCTFHSFNIQFLRVSYLFNGLGNPIRIGWSAYVFTVPLVMKTPNFLLIK